MDVPENVQIVSRVSKLTGSDPTRNPQGLGVDPDQWKAQKEEYKK